jgi:signal transduction histidine kinase/ActR/RegA family two-component response regulator
MKPGTLIARVARSLRGKLMLIALATTFCALLFAAIALAIHEARTYNRALLEDLQTQAEIIGHAAEPALAFEGPDVGRDMLRALRLRPQILAAALYAADGKLFARYPEDATVPERARGPGHAIEDGRLVLFHEITVKAEPLGTLYLATRHELDERIADSIKILGAVMVASLLIAALMSAWLHGRIMGPIQNVARVAREVMDRRDFTLRVRASGDDEIAELVQAFNDMLSELGSRAEALEAAYATLQHEIAERRSAEQALRIADRRKDEFLATLAHELRNPLAPLKNGLDILRHPDSSPERLAQVRELMERQLGHLVRLVDDLLDVSRISTGKLTVRRERVELHAIVASAIETSRPLLDARQHKITVDIPHQRIWLDADSTRLAQVLSNLLNNAAKYTSPGGSIRLRVTPSATEVEIALTDSGVGIPAAMIDRVFDMFAQVDTGLDRSTAGLGVGLTLAKRLTELHGGTIRATSEGAGKGSTFTIRLPVDSPGAGEAVERIEGAPTRSVSPHRILLADDNVDFAASLAFILRGMGHDVLVAHDGSAALAAAKEFRPDVAFLDIGLPKLHGYALARLLREHPGTRSALLVAITGWGQDRDRQQAKDAGFDRHFVKPVAVEQILEAIAAAPRAAASAQTGQSR